MSVRIITRKEWGFDGWLRAQPGLVNERDRRFFFVHYNGPATGGRVGVRVPRDVHAFHKSRGWLGIGYGHVVTQDGAIYEGRGFNLQGSHCPGFNVTGYSAMGFIGEGESPSPAMLASIRWLRGEAARRSGRALVNKGHRDEFQTACPGGPLYAWVQAGMPASTTTTKDGFDMASVADLRAELMRPEFLKEVARYVATGFPMGSEGLVLSGQFDRLSQLTRIAIAAANDDLTPDQVRQALADAVSNAFVAEGDVRLVPKTQES